VSGRVLVQETLLGLIQGSTFILIAVGFTLVWGTLRLINFAQIGLYTVGGFVFVGVDQAIGRALSPVAGYALAAGVAFLVVGVLGGIVALGTWYPIRTAPNFALLVASLAVFIIIQNLVQLYVSARPVHVPNPLSGTLFSIAGVPISASALVVLVTGIGGAALVAVGMQITKFGRAVRAIADDPTSARLLGIPYVRIVALTFALAAGLAGLAGALVNAHYGEVSYSGGIDIGLSGFAAAVLGGMGSLWGAIVGGLLLGLISSYAVTVLPSSWQDAVVFAVLIIVLAVRPTGILRTKTADRA
jgi:branched-chain amino acid transport system permease protein